MNLKPCVGPPMVEKTRGILNPKTFLIMRLIILLTLLSCLKVTANVYAQQISINVKDAPIEKVLDEIKKQSGYSLIAEDHLLDNIHNVTLTLKNATVQKALEQCFKGQPVIYEVTGKTILLKAKPQTHSYVPPDKQLIDTTITGRVTDTLGKPLQGVTIRLKGTNRIALTDASGFYRFIKIPEDGDLVYSILGFTNQEHPVAANKGGIVDVVLSALINALQEVSVVNNGYQNLPKERSTGSFLQINNSLFNRSVSTNVLDRLNGITTGVAFRRVTPAIATSPTSKNTGITVRGVSTFMSSTEPLIVLDNFPYEGEIANINPNDVESITILKDAAAASIWGARSGNGVIIITTKKGRKNQAMKINFNSNITIANKPDLSYDLGFLNSKDYIEAEQYLFNNGFFDSDLKNTTTRPIISPAVEIMAKLKAGTITADDANSQLDILRNIDVRNDYTKYVYQKAINQQYSLGLRGGTDKLTYSLSGGIDKDRSNLIRNGYNRISLNSLNTYSLTKNIELTAGINYSQNTTLRNNSFAYDAYSVGGKYGYLFPYAQLADANGSPLAVSTPIRDSYLNDAESKGFLDWHNRPLDEIAFADNTTKINDLLTRFGIKYKIIPQLSAEINYQNEHQQITTQNNQSQSTYYVRNLINKYSVYNASNSTFTYNFPLGGILTQSNYDWHSNNLRGQFNYDQAFNKHNITAIAGAEIRELQTTGIGQTLFGYDDQFGTSNTALNYNTTYPTNPSGSSRLPDIGGSVSGVLNRYVSYYTNIAYSYDNRYTLNLSGRKDGANLFGAKVNDKITPLWSAGLGWNASREEFYHFALIPYLQLRATYGFNGNVYENGSAFLTGRYFTDGTTGAQDIANVTAPNPELQWEKIRNINFGIDFEFAKSILKGSIEFYQKDGKDLIQPTVLAPQTGFLTYTANTANTHTTGWDITLTSQNFNRGLKWSTTLLFSAIKDRVIRYDAPRTSTSISNFGGVVGKPLFAIYAYKWAGLDPQTGAPQGYLNGKVSQDYTGIVNNFNPDSLVYAGSSRPTVFGAFRNDFYYKGFGLSVNMRYSFGFVTRRSSVNLNYTSVLTTGANSDYALRWQKPGDERTTNVPSLIYPNNTNRNNFYQYSDALIIKGDNIRLQDIRLSYDLPATLLKSKFFEKVQLYAYANNVGIIWRKNKLGIDPEATTQYIDPRSFSIGLNANFK
nr:SusC/RagA family TonB-linked outer membrane protein [Mucilaginibacter sp. L294]